MKRPWLLIGLAATICGAALAVGTPIASGGNVNCTGPLTGSVNGNVSAQTGCAITNAQITGNVQAQNTSGPISICDASIHGNLEVHNGSGPVSISGASIGGNLQIHNWAGPVTVDGSCGSNSVGGNTEIHDNSGLVTISDTATGGNLQCQHDSPPATNGGGNTVEGKTTGSECSSSTTMHCQTGQDCSVTVHDGNTTATVDADGSGKSGTLTVTLSPPPASDGCDVGEGSDAPSGDLVTVNPPGGYGPSNPISVDITYSGDEGFFVMCKSNDGGKTYFPLPECTFFNEGPAPDNVPCLAVSDPLVYITSTDPSLNGHA